LINLKRDLVGALKEKTRIRILGVKDFLSYILHGIAIKKMRQEEVRFSIHNCGGFDEIIKWSCQRTQK